MKLAEIDRFVVLHRKLGWPWVAFDARATRIAFASADDTIATRVVDGAGAAAGPSFTLPKNLQLAESEDAGLRGFAIASTGLAAIGKDTVVTIRNDGAVSTSKLSALVVPDFVARAVAFDRSGERIWLSVESNAESALLVIDATTHDVIGTLRSKPFPPPSNHELFVHAADDAVLLLCACGQDGTFARVAGWTDGPVVSIDNALRDGGISAGFVGFSGDGAHVHLAEADELRTHAWPSLHELSSVPLADDFISSFAGVVLGERIFVDGEDAETQLDAVMQFDRSAIRGALLAPPFPPGMWAGRFGADAIVTVDSKGDPAEARIVRIPMPHS